MKLIGITGKSGVGKTEFANYFKDKKTVGVITVDDLLSEAKRKYFGVFLEPNNNEAKKNSSHPKLRSNVKKLFYSNKILFNMLMKFRSNILRKPMLAKLKELEYEGKEMAIIDDWALATHSYLRNKFEKIYVIEKAYTERREALRNRENLSTEEAKVWDMPFALNFYKIPVGYNVDTLKNDGTLKEWKEKAEKVYSKYHMPTFDEILAVEVEKVHSQKISEKTFEKQLTRGDRQ